MAFSIWYLEKEFGFLIDDKFPLMKFMNLMDEYNINEYKKIMESNSPATNNKTFR